MSIILRLGAVGNNDVGGYKDLSSEYCSLERGIGGGNRSIEEHFQPASPSYPGCFGLPYQDHNYVAAPPRTPPPVPVHESPSPQKVSPQTTLTTETAGTNAEVTDIGSLPTVPPEETPATAEAYPVEDNSVTRCICDFIHDDGYMICCDKCSVWQHIDCMGVDRNNIPDTYFCELCEPRQLDRERARQIQLKKKEFLDTLTVDSSATDTDPEEASNRQMAQQQQQALENNSLLQGLKKVKKKRRSKSGSGNGKVNNKVDGKQKKQKKEKKDVKKEKENKELNKSQKISNTKDATPALKTRKSKLQASKKPGLSLIINENTQDPWDSSYSPWVDKYEEACENLYSADVQSLFTNNKINGVNTPEKIVTNGQLCHVTDVNKNRKGLEASETIGEGENVIEYTGKVMLKHMFDKDNFFKYLNPFVLFYSKFDNVELCIDATSYGNTARFIRRSCKANAEVRHVLENGKIYFYVYSVKVIPRGSEITIPYDYNYKECTYCVECACLRNNCAVSKYFKRKMNANNKKEKSPIKTPKSPIRSPVKMKDKQQSQSPGVVEEPQTLEVNKVLSPKKEPQISMPGTSEQQQQQPQPASKVVTRASSSEQATENSDPAVPAQNSESHSETDEPQPAEKNQHKMTREERKMEAIMKAFEKLEKREERRKEALSRMDCRKSTETKKEEKEPSSETTVAKKEVKKEKGKTKEKEKEKHVKTEEEASTIVAVTEEKAPVSEAPVKEEKPVPISPSPVEEEPVKIVIDEKVEEEVKPEIPVVEMLPVETVKEKPKPRMKRSKKVCNRRRSRANSGTAVVMETSLSLDDESNSAPTLASCPSTPISAPVDVTTTSPSFKFLKTKKHLMNEWLSEKSQDSFTLPDPLPDSGNKMEPLEVRVEETIFVPCLPSPRNAMDHLRRNSQNSGTTNCKNSVAESSVGSAKKRWLRQAMWEKPKSNSGSSSPVPASSGGASPSLPSPGASPPGDFVTPLKKRRMARESCDTPLVVPTVSPTVTPVLGTDTVMSSCDDSEGLSVDPQFAITEDKSSLAKPTEEKVQVGICKMDIPKKRNFLIQKDSEPSRADDSCDTDVLQSDSSQHISPQVEQERNITHTGNTASAFHSSMDINEDRTSCSVDGNSSLESEKECEVTNSVKNHNCMESHDSCSMDRLNIDVACSSYRNEEEAISGVVNDADEDMTSETEEGGVTEESECTKVDSTEDQISENSEQILERHSICDSTSRSDDLKITAAQAESSQQTTRASFVCNSETIEESSPCVGSSTDSSKLLEECMNSSSQSDRGEVDSVFRENSEQHFGNRTLTGFVDNSVCKTTGNEIVGSSSDDNREIFPNSGVSSSSEKRLSNTQEPQSTSVSDNAGVTSSISLLEHSTVVSESESVDSSVSEINTGLKMETEHVAVVMGSLGNSDSGYSSKQEEISSVQGDISVGHEHFVEATSSSSIEDDSAVPQSAEVPTSSASNVSELTSFDVDSTSSTTPEHAPPPQKKKVSLLEYRQRLKEKGSTSKSTHSSTSFSSSHRSSLSSSSSSSSSTPSKHSHRLSSLPSLPLFDATSPTRDSVRHQFKSSSDLIRRKSAEKKREKPLSLTERLKQEFGFEDDEEQQQEEEKPPDPPPPQTAPNTHAPHGISPQGVTPHMTQMAHNVQGSIQTGCQLPVMMRGHTSPLVPPPGPSIPPQHSGVVNQIHNVILPSPSSNPVQTPVPSPSSMTGVNGPNSVPQATNHYGSVTIPVTGGPDSSALGPAAGTGRKIPSLMSLQTFPAQNMVPPNKQPKSGTSSGLQNPPVNGPIQSSPDPSFVGQHQGMLSQNQMACTPHQQSSHNQHGFKSSQQMSQTGQQHIYPSPQANATNSRPPTFHQQSQSHSYSQPQDGTNFNMLPHAQSSNMCEQQIQLQPNGVVIHDYNHGLGSGNKVPHDSVHHQQSQSCYSPDVHSQGSVQRKKSRKTNKYKKDIGHSRTYSDYH